MGIAPSFNSLGAIPTKLNVMAEQELSIQHKKDLRMAENLEREHGHGFTVHNSLKEMHEFFRTPDDEWAHIHTEPRFGRSNPKSKNQRARSKGQR